MIFFPPNRHQTNAERNDDERDNLKKRSPPDRPFFQPQDQKQRRRQRRGCGFCEQCEQAKEKRSKIKNTPAFARCIETFDPCEQSEQKEKSHQNIFQLRNPGDRLHLNWMQCEDRGGEPWRRNVQP